MHILYALLTHTKKNLPNPMNTKRCFRLHSSWPWQCKLQAYAHDSCRVVFKPVFGIHA